MKLGKIVERRDQVLITFFFSSLAWASTFFINVVSSLPDVTLDFKEIEQKQIVLTSGKSEITLKGKDADQYPRIQEISASSPLVLETSVLKNINLEIEQGEFVSIIGLSGAGKSTLIRTINRMLDISEGKLTVDGIDVTKLKGKSLRKFRRNKVGMIFQSYPC